jgi:hypothetical protein
MGWCDYWLNFKMVSVAKARPPMVGKRFKADCNQGVDFKEGAKYQKTKQMRPMIKIQCLFSHWKSKDLDLMAV